MLEVLSRCAAKINMSSEGLFFLYLISSCNIICLEGLMAL